MAGGVIGRSHPCSGRRLSFELLPERADFAALGLRRRAPPDRDHARRRSSVRRAATNLRRPGNAGRAPSSHREHLPSNGAAPKWVHRRQATSSVDGAHCVGINSILNGLLLVNESTFFEIQNARVSIEGSGVTNRAKLGRNDVRMHEKRRTSFEGKL